MTFNPRDTSYLVARLAERGVATKTYFQGGNSKGTADRVAVPGLAAKLRDIGVLVEKHIPLLYLRASCEQRIELLRGLMDTDGHVAPNGDHEITSSNKRFADSIYELLVSLGHKPRRSDRIPTFTYNGEKRNGQRSYRINFTPKSTCGCTLTRHVNRIDERAKHIVARPSHTSRRFIRDVRQVDSVPVRCVAVSHHSHLFVVGRQMVPTHNTDIGINWLAYSVICDPMDMILYQTSQVTARDFSRRRIDRLNRFTREVGERLLARGDADNTYDKYYRNGMIFTLSWPSIGELSGRPVGRAWLTDLDRMPQDVDGEGSPFDLARKRNTTFGSAAMTYAESSPGFEIEDPKWIRRSPHEAPPCPGILALYNRGDRRRWMWPCIHCKEFFEPEFGLLKWPETTDIMEAAEQAKIMCPHCASLIDSSHKHESNLRGRWLREGQSIDRDGKVHGTPVRADIASFWLKGPAATFSSWSDLVSRYLLAEQEFQRTGSQEALKSTVNTDQGEPFYPRGLDRERLPDELKARSLDVPEREVPMDSRFLLATVDVQKNRWVAQVFGVGPGIADEPFRLVVVDRFDIVKSKRLDDDGERWPVRPAKYLEDWDLLVEQVLDREYPMADGSGTMRVAMLGVDSGGREGVTTNAYNWYRKLRKEGSGEHQRVHLLKGEALPSSPRVRLSYPDSPKKDRRANARGEIPVLILNTNLIKDALNNMVERGVTDGASFAWPGWLPDEWFSEMCAEFRTPKGWENPRKARNEAWDLATYAIAICLHRKVDRLRWDAPAFNFALERSRNPYFRPAAAAAQPEVADSARGSYSLADLASRLA
jgi:phage terminase large subunit GpA-like protein